LGHLAVMEGDRNPKKISKYTLRVKDLEGAGEIGSSFIGTELAYSFVP